MSDNYRKITDIDLGAQTMRERIIKLLIEADTSKLTAEAMTGWYFALALITEDDK